MSNPGVQYLVRVGQQLNGRRKVFLLKRNQAVDDLPICLPLYQQLTAEDTGNRMRRMGNDQRTGPADRRQ